MDFFVSCIKGLIFFLFLLFFLFVNVVVCRTAHKSQHTIRIPSKSAAAKEASPPDTCIHATQVCRQCKSQQYKPQELVQECRLRSNHTLNLKSRGRGGLVSRRGLAMDTHIGGASSRHQHGDREGQEHVQADFASLHNRVKHIFY
jgi:hypothetical protein